jgi:hypothetical protein
MDAFLTADGLIALATESSEKTMSSTRICASTATNRPRPAPARSTCSTSSLS